MTSIERLCVFCGSSMGTRSEYQEAVQDLAQLLVLENIGLVYGGASIGLMGRLADQIMQLGGDVIGVMPQSLVSAEVAHRGLRELRIVETMHERKSVMFDMSDGFMALPGGFGTLEELMEIATWLQLGLHTKPAGILNVAGYFSGLLALFDRAVEERFVREIHRGLVLVDTRPDQLLAQMRAFQPPPVPRWLDEEDR